MRLAAPAPRTLPPNLYGPLVRIPEGRGAAVTALLVERARLARARADIDEAEEHLFRAAQKAGGRTTAATDLLFPDGDDPGIE